MLIDALYRIYRQECFFSAVIYQWDQDKRKSIGLTSHTGTQSDIGLTKILGIWLNYLLFMCYLGRSNLQQNLLWEFTKNFIMSGDKIDIDVHLNSNHSLLRAAYLKIDEATYSNVTKNMKMVFIYNIFEPLLHSCIGETKTLVQWWRGTWYPK